MTRPLRSVGAVGSDAGGVPVLGVPVLGVPVGGGSVGGGSVGGGQDPETGALPVVMGIVNVTPDSFSDGGRFLAPERAVQQGLKLVAEGADLLDIGGESTRPGASPVSLEEELARVTPVLEGLARGTRAPLSIDTTKASVARRAIEAGATVVNDVSAGLDDPRMLDTVAELAESRDLYMVLMHRQGSSSTMQVAPSYRDAVAQVGDHLAERIAAAEAAGVPSDRLAVDPGIGFGKRLEHNLALLASLGALRALGKPIVLGVSRKAFIGHVTGAQGEHDWLARERSDEPSDRIGGTLAAILASGADVVRVHDAGPVREALLVSRAIERARQMR